MREGGRIKDEGERMKDENSGLAVASLYVLISITII